MGTTREGGYIWRGDPGLIGLNARIMAARKPGSTRQAPWPAPWFKELPPIRHGTTGGYRQHYVRDEPPCDPCREADREADRKLKRARRARQAAREAGPK